MNKKILQIIELFLEEKKISFNKIEDKKENFIVFHLFVNYLKNYTYTIKLETYNHYLVLNIFGYEMFEKISLIVENKSNILNILDFFIKKELKIRLFTSNGKPYSWEIYVLKNNFWYLYKHHKKIFRKIFSKKTSSEIDIETLKKLQFIASPRRNIKEELNG